MGAMGNLYAPRRAEIVKVAKRARLANQHPDAKRWLVDKLKRPPSDWDCRTPYTVPGLVWTVGSDTCMTGRLSAPDNIAYDPLGREFVYRQPLNEAGLAAIMSADSEEVFACYRFDGLERWTRQSLDAWLDRRDVIVGWLEHCLATEREGEIADSLRACHDYLVGDEFRTYVAALRELLSRDPTATGGGRLGQD